MDKCEGPKWKIHVHYLNYCLIVLNFSIPSLPSFTYNMPEEFKSAGCCSSDCYLQEFAHARRNCIILLRTYFSDRNDESILFFQCMIFVLCLSPNYILIYYILICMTDILGSGISAYIERL